MSETRRELPLMNGTESRSVSALTMLRHCAANAEPYLCKRWTHTLLIKHTDRNISKQECAILLDQLFTVYSRVRLKTVTVIC